jgi:hypothetical protein
LIISIFTDLMEKESTEATTATTSGDEESVNISAEEVL